MTNWDAYARTTHHGQGAYEAEPVQGWRAERIADLCVGSVLDVGSSDGYVASRIKARGLFVFALDISPIRIQRCWDDYQILGKVGDATNLPYADGTFTTVVLGEILEHLPNPGLALAEASRVAAQRVIVSVPLNGWADPTHEWRIRLDVFSDSEQHAKDPTKGEQIVLTWEKGRCWPPDYYRTDDNWKAMFDAHHGQ